LSDEKSKPEDTKQEPKQQKKQAASCGFACMSPNPRSKDATHNSASFVPQTSNIVKEGFLMKVGQRTGTMLSRYYILRDNGLFVYNNRNQEFPSTVISLRGLYVN